MQRVRQRRPELRILEILGWIVFQMTLRDEKAEHATNRCERARHASRGNAGAAQRLEVANDVYALDAIELDGLIAEPVAEMPQIDVICGERVLGEPFLDREVIEKDRHVGDEVRRAFRLLSLDLSRFSLRCHSERSEQSGGWAVAPTPAQIPRYARDDIVATTSAM